MSPTSIHEACGRGDIDTVRALIATDVSLVDAADEHGWRPIFHAGLWRREAIVRLLIDAGADLAAQDGAVLHYASEVPNNRAVVSLLLQYGVLDAHVRPSDDLSRQFLAAVFSENTDRVNSLLNRHPHLATTPDGFGDQAIHHASRIGNTEIVRRLLEHGADANARTTRGQTVLYCAGGHAHLDCLLLLLEKGVNRDSQQGLMDFLAKYPHDPRFHPIAEALRRHMTRA